MQFSFYIMSFICFVLFIFWRVYTFSILFHVAFSFSAVNFPNAMGCIGTNCLSLPLPTDENMPCTCSMAVYGHKIDLVV